MYYTHMKRKPTPLQKVKNMATKAMEKLIKFFKGTESKKEEAAEKKVSPAMYAKGEKAEGAKSTSAKKPMRSAAVPAKKVVAKKAVAKTTTKPAKKK